eukprot:436695_1
MWDSKSDIRDYVLRFTSMSCESQNVDKNSYASMVASSSSASWERLRMYSKTSAMCGKRHQRVAQQQAGEDVTDGRLRLCVLLVGKREQSPKKRKLDLRCSDHANVR